MNATQARARLRKIPAKNRHFCIRTMPGPYLELKRNQLIDHLSEVIQIGEHNGGFPKPEYCVMECGNGLYVWVDIA